MNPKGVNDLDPKLRETYERIMGTAPGSSSGNPANNEPTHPVLETHTEPQIQSPAQGFINPTPIPQPQIIKPNDPFMPTVPPPAEVITKNAVVNSEKKKNGLMPILFVLFAVIFFVAYAVFWAKIFGLF